jgi:cytochrome b subunit of formate dehydrogenase
MKVRSLLFTAILFSCVPLAAQLTSEECLGCHSDATLTKDLGNGKTQSVSVDAKLLGGSVHAGLDCTMCHADVKAYPHEPAPARVDCGSCHSDAVAAHQNGVHAKALAAGNRNAATCLSCHGVPHGILPSSDPKSKTYRTTIPATCGSCHSQKFVMEGSGVSSQPIFSYAESVHGKAVAKGSMKAAVCTDCHDHHEILTPREQHSPINKFNIPMTCGKCHEGVRAQFMTSIHGKAIAKGNSQAPVCTDCHGIHNIKPHIDPNSSVASQQIARTTCGQCHGGVKLTQELGIPAGRLKSYEDSYHGLAQRVGSKIAANCASCHGVHNILPSSDPKSPTNKANLAKTCGKCHEGAGSKFAIGKVHVQDGDGVGTAALGGDGTGETIIHWVKRVYIVLIVLTIGFMLFHNFLVWFRKALAKRRNPNRVIERMNLNQRIQHVVLMVSFTILVLSGFALAYPESHLAWIVGSSESARSIVHRVAGAIMLLLGAYHVIYMVATREGRQGIKDFWFRWKDASDLIGNLKYYSGLSKTKPMIARFGYPEKLEYWAMIWGTIVMGVTGLMLWFKVGVSQMLQRWWVDVAGAIHFWEAVLATLAIVVWHFYHVIFDPDVYPVSWTALDGKVSEEEYRHEHGLAYEEWKREHGGGPKPQKDEE